jgi:hypothetical protein
LVCREFGISRKTGYKIFNRYKDIGLRGLEDRPKSPYRHPNKLPFQVEKAILRIKQEYATWGAPKIRDKLIKQGAFPVFERAFREFGLPAAIRTDNGVPFASAHPQPGSTTPQRDRSIRFTTGRYG